MTIRLLFFYVENDFCRHYFQKHVGPYDDVTEVFNMTNKNAETLDMAARYDVAMVPTLIYIDPAGEIIKRWNGGIAPEPGYLSIEIGLAKENDRQRE